MAYTENRRTIFNLVGDVVDEMTHLFQTELRLLRAEVNQKINRFTNGGIMIGAGIVALFAALFLLLQAVVRWLAIAGLPERWGLILVGVVVGAIGAFLLTKGTKNIKETTLVPDRAVDQIRADFVTVKEHVT